MAVVNLLVQFRKVKYLMRVHFKNKTTDQESLLFLQHGSKIIRSIKTLRGSGWGTHVNPWLFHSNV